MAAPQPPWPAGNPPSRRGCARQLSQATSQLLLSVRRDRGGPSRSSGSEGGRMGSEGSGTRGMGQFAAPLLGYLWAGGQRALARPPPATDTVLWPARPRWSWDRSAGPGQGSGIPPSPARGTSRRDGDGTGLRMDAVTSLLPPARWAPAPLKGALRGPAAHGGAAKGLCSGEYRHFTLNIKRRIAFVTYRSQRGVSVDSKRGERRSGERRGGWQGGRGAVSTLLSLRERCPGAGMRRPRCSSRRGLET